MRELFDQAIALPKSQRAEFLEQRCGNPQQRAQLQQLLDAADAIGESSALAGDPLEWAQHIGESTSAQFSPIGSMLGPFHLEALLGEGASAHVYRATRSHEGVTQTFALKVLRHGLASANARLQFDRERHALARLNHPNIARLMDGGITDLGVAYIALEFVDGVDLLSYVRQRQLSSRQRVELMIEVARTVSAAHQSLVVHRDLKPANILVSHAGEIKLLDFGVAKLLQSESGDDSQTQSQFRAFTPAYAAPEQHSGDSITTATDVFALGIILGELLTGERLNDGGSSKPSQRVSDNSDPGVLPFPPKQTRKLLRGDLDNILAKATAIEPHLRYHSAASFADDLTRFLAHQPVHAHPPSQWYRISKFVARHRGGVTVAILVSSLVLSALAIALWQTRIAREQTKIAHNESMRANATLAFVVDLLKTASAELPKDQRPTPEALIKDAAKNAREDPALDPMVRAQLLLTLGEIARSNGDYANAEALIDESIQGMRALSIPTSSREWIDALVAKGNLLHSTDRSKQADQLMAELLPDLEGVETVESVSALMLYGTTRYYAGDADQAVATAQLALKTAQRVFGPDSTNGIETATYVGQLCSSMRRYREAAAILEEAIPRWRKLGLPLNEQFARSLFHLAVARRHLNRRSEVEPLFVEGIALLRSVQEGPYHRVAQGLLGYAEFMIESERFEEAAVAIDEALAISLAVVGENSARTAMARRTKGLLLRAQYENEAAVSAFRAAQDVLLQHVDGAGYGPELSQLRLELSATLLDLGQSDQALVFQEQAIKNIPQQFGDSSAEFADATCLAAAIRLPMGEHSAALDLSVRALTMFESLDNAALQREIRCRVTQAKSLLASGRADAALLQIQRAMQQHDASFPQAKVIKTALLLMLARCERATGNEESARNSISRARELAVATERLSAEDRQLLHAELR